MRRENLVSLELGKNIHKIGDGSGACWVIEYRKEDVKNEEPLRFTLPRDSAGLRLKRIAPRIGNGPTLLAGIARCGHCGAGLVLNTGKGGAYRYYCCARKMREGAIMCEGPRIRMDRLDDIVVEEVTGQVLKPDRLHQLLDSYVRSDSERLDQRRQQISRMRQDHKETEAAITRLLTLVEKGLIDADDPSMRERLIGLKLRRDELAADIAYMQRRANDGAPTITRDKIKRFAALLRDKLNNGSPELKQAYARLVMTEVTVQDREKSVSGLPQGAGKGSIAGAYRQITGGSLVCSGVARRPRQLGEHICP